MADVGLYVPIVMNGEVNRMMEDRKYIYTIESIDKIDAVRVVHERNIYNDIYGISNTSPFYRKYCCLW